MNESTEHQEIGHDESERAVRALNDLLKALSFGGHTMVQPVVVICREREHNSLVTLHAGVEFDKIPMLLRLAADTAESEPPDVSRHSPGD